MLEVDLVKTWVHTIWSCNHSNLNALPAKLLHAIHSMVALCHKEGDYSTYTLTDNQHLPQANQVTLFLQRDHHLFTGIPRKVTD
jgi:hypothetical protein